MRMMVAIARLSNTARSVSLANVAEKTQISRRYLEQLAISLRNADLIRGIAGKGGGYTLTRTPTDISLGQIVEAAIGPINIVECLRRPETCLESETCECRWVFQTVNDRITQVFSELSLDDIVDQPRHTPIPGDTDILGSSCPTQKRHSVEMVKEDGR